MQKILPRKGPIHGMIAVHSTDSEAERKVSDLRQVCGDCISIHQGIGRASPLRALTRTKNGGPCVGIVRFKVEKTDVAQGRWFHESSLAQ